MPVFTLVKSVESNVELEVSLLYVIRKLAVNVVPVSVRPPPIVISCTGVVVELEPRSFDVVDTACILAYVTALFAIEKVCVATEDDILRSVLDNVCADAVRLLIAVIPVPARIPLCWVTVKITEAAEGGGLPPA